MLFFVSVVALGLIVGLGWYINSRLGASRIEAMANKRRATSRTVTSGEFVDGNRHMKVALALTSTDLHYENADMQAYLDLRWVQEVEYDSSLATGKEVEGGKVLRLRSNSQVFEFVLPDKVVPTWHLMLPPRRQVEIPPATAPATTPVAVAV